MCSATSDSGPRELYPPLPSFMDTRLDVGGGHQLYLEQSGTPDGIPVLFLHGGPGSGCEEKHRCYFDPARYRIILFDQRGSHRSTPQGGIEHNTTDDLLQDMERIRQQLGIEQWLLYGGSWGATLALLYAGQHPERVLGMILRGSFLAREADLHWFVGGGTRDLFPDHWQRFVDFFPPEDAQSGAAMARFLHRELDSEQAARREAAARAWAQWAGTVVMAPQGVDYCIDEETIPQLIGSVRIEMHYAVHRYFITENQILEQAALLPEVPIHLIHGRNDLTCLPAASWTLHQALPGSTLEMVSGAGHLAGEPLMIDTLLRATDGMAARLGGQP